MCSPLGNATMNSLMNVATFLLEITSHSHSFTPSTLSGTLMAISPFTFTWQPRRQWSCICLRLKCGVSEGKISPPPSITWHLHCPQEPLPPQAEERNTPFTDSVFSNVEPEATSSSLSPLIVSFTLPEGTKKFLATSRITTSRMTTTRNTPMLANIIFISIVLFLSFRCSNQRNT